LAFKNKHGHLYYDRKGGLSHLNEILPITGPGKHPENVVNLTEFDSRSFLLDLKHLLWNDQLCHD